MYFQSGTVAVSTFAFVILREFWCLVDFMLQDVAPANRQSALRQRKIAPLSFLKHCDTQKGNGHNQSDLLNGIAFVTHKNELVDSLCAINQITTHTSNKAWCRIKTWFKAVPKGNSLLPFNQIQTNLHPVLHPVPSGGNFSARLYIFV